MFQLNSNIKRKLSNNELLGRDINKIECEVQNEINKLNLNNRNCSYQIRLNNYSWEVLICSKRNVVIEDLKQLKDDYYIKYGFENLNKIESWGNFNIGYDDKKFKLILSRIKVNWRKPKQIEWSNDFFIGTDIEKDREIFREIYNWKESVNYY